MSEAPSTALSALSLGQLKIIDDVLDVLIPGGDGMPSARSVETSVRLLPMALDLRPDLRVDLDDFVARVGEQIVDTSDPKTAVRSLATNQPELFSAVTGLLAGAYYLDPEVRESLGYPGQEERPLTDETESYVDLLERVIDRGSVYRDPSAPQHSLKQEGAP